jgi:hypothetical protein
MPRKPKGRHPHHKLTAVKVKGVKTAGRYADGNGLYLFVEPSGSKRWVLRTVVHTDAGTKRRDLGLGSAQLVSLADARAEAARLRLDARKRIDILAARRIERRIAPTFEAAAKTVHAEHGRSFRNSKHRAGWLASLAADVFPLIGTRPVNAIDSGDVLKVLKPGRFKSLHRLLTASIEDCAWIAREVRTGATAGGRFHSFDVRG